MGQTTYISMFSLRVQVSIYCVSTYLLTYLHNLGLGVEGGVHLPTQFWEIQDGSMLWRLQEG